MTANYTSFASGTGVTMPNAFGCWLKNERKKKHLTQEALAEISDLTKAQISRLESGIQGTKTPTAVRLATALGADPRDALRALMADAPGMDSESVRDRHGDVDSQTVEILQLLALFPPEEREVWIASFKANLKSMADIRGLAPGKERELGI